MSDIFISCANEDRSRAEQLAGALQSLGWSTFWNREIPTGTTWRRRHFIGNELDGARCIMVLWSAASGALDWVQEEEAKQRGNLIPVLIDAAVQPPIAFRDIQTADLSQWDGEEDSPAFRALHAAPKTRSSQRRQRTALFRISAATPSGRLLGAL